MIAFDLASPIWTPGKPAIIRPAEHALLRPGAFRPVSRAERRAIIADLVRSGRLTRDQAGRAVIFIPWEGGGAWHTIFSVTTDTAGTGWGTYNARNILAVAGYTSPPATGTKIRVTLSAVGAGGTVNVALLYAGHKAGTYDFDGNQVPLLFSGSASVAITDGNVAVSDETAFSFDATKALIVSIGFGATSRTGRKTTGLPSGFDEWSDIGQSANAGANSPTLTSNDGYDVSLAKVEIFA